MLDLQIMTDNSENKHNEEIIRELNNICDECKREDESVSQNLILTSYRLFHSISVKLSLLSKNLISTLSANLGNS